MLHHPTIDPHTLELLRKLQELPVLSNTRLVGGTALALQIGHRKSVDLDIFGNIQTDSLDLIQYLNTIGKVIQIKESPNIHIFSIDGIKVDIVNYPYPWLSPLKIKDDIKLAALEDICAMKLAAITGRGSKKDFIDIHFLLQHFTLKEMLVFYNRKYTDGSSFLVLKSLSYFEDAENEPSPVMLTDTSWDTVKNNIKTHLQKQT